MLKLLWICLIKLHSIFVGHCKRILHILDFRYSVTHSVKKKKEPIQIHFSFCSISVVFNFFKNKKIKTYRIALILLQSCRSPLNPFNTNIPSSGAQPVKKKPIIKTEPRAVPIKSEPRSLPRPNIPDPEDNFDEVDGIDLGMGPAVKQEIVEDLPQSSECQGMTSVKSIMVKMLWSETKNC